MDTPVSAQPTEPRVTTVADNVHRSSVEPYGVTPVLDIPSGVVACQFCGNTRFRRSRMRIFDVRELLLLRYPMRCMRCNQRQYGSMLTAGLALAAKSHGPRLARGHETWKAWTERGATAAELQRPMSTAVGTRANNLQAVPGPIPARPTKPANWKEDDRQIW